MINSVTVLYVAILVSTHQSVLETFTSVFVLLLHDFAQHAIISSHNWGSVVLDAVKKRMLLSASVGAELLLLNTCLSYVAFLGPVIYLFRQVSQEWGLNDNRLEPDASLVLRSIWKISQNGVLQGDETMIAFVSVIPSSLVTTGAFWLSATTYGSMCFRRALHGSRLENLCLDDVMVNGLVSSVSLLTGVRMVKMAGSFFSVIEEFEGAVDIYREGSVGHYPRRSKIIEALLDMWMSGFDVSTSICCQGLMCAAVAKRDIFGRRCEITRTLIKIWGFELIFGALRVGVLVDWENWVVSFGGVIVASFVVSVVANYVWDKYGWLKYMEQKRERALCR